MWTPTPTLTPTPGVVHKLFWTSSRRAKNEVSYTMHKANRQTDAYHR